MATTSDSKPKELKVTDKRIFTPEGDLREEFRDEIKPVSDPMAARPAATEPEKPPEKPVERRTEKREPPREERRRTIADKAQSPGTAFTDFVEPLIAQAYMSLGMLRNPYQPKPQIALGSVVEDSSGRRQAALYVPGNTTGHLQLADGSTRPVEDLSLRLTEYTVGAEGPRALRLQVCSRRSTTPDRRFEE